MAHKLLMHDRLPVADVLADCHIYSNHSHVHACLLGPALQLHFLYQPEGVTAASTTLGKGPQSW